MITYTEVRELAVQLPLTEQARLIKDLIAALLVAAGAEEPWETLEDREDALAAHEGLVAYRAGETEPWSQVRAELLDDAVSS